MDNYGNDYFMSQEGYASIDFTLLDRPNSNIASAPESTAALLPDLHVADSSFSSFDFLDGPGVDAFGGVLRDADEAHSRDQGGYRSELQKYKKERSLLQNSVGLHRGDADTDSELPSAEFQIPFEVQKPISNLDFFSQGQAKESGHREQHAHSDPGNEAADTNHDYFDGQISQQTHTAGGAAGGGWYNTWGGSANQGDQTQVFFQTPSYEEPSDERRLMQMKGSTSQLAGQMGYHSLSSSQVPSSDPVPKATHSFLPTAKQSDSRQAANMGLGQSSTHVNGPPSTAIKSSPRGQPFDYEGMMNGSSANQFRHSSSTPVENTAPSRRHQTNDANLGGQDTLRSHAQSQNYKYTGQTLGSLAPVEAAPLKVNDYEFLGGQYVLKGQTPGEIGQQLGVEEMQTWHQHPLVSQSNPQQTSFQQPYQDLSRHHQHQVDQQAQHSRQQQLQQFLAVSHQNQSLGNQSLGNQSLGNQSLGNQSLGNQSLGNQSLGNQLSAFLSESSLQDLPRVVQPERQNAQLAVDNPRGLMQSTYQTVNNWSATDPSNMPVLAHDYLMGSDHNFNWQALALKASQVDPPMYSSVPAHRRDATGQPVSAYAGMQGGSLQEYFSGAAKLNQVPAQVGKPVARSHGAGGSGGSMFGSEYQPEVYDAAASLQTTTQSNKHQALGNMPFWQTPYPQSVEHNRSGGNLGQTNLPPRSPQLPANSQVRQQRNWTGLSGQQDTLQGGLFSHNLANAEALKQSILAGGNIQHSSHQSANPRQSSRPQSIEAAQYIQQSSSQAASGSQFLNALGTKQQTNWSRHSPQPWNSGVNNVESWQLNRSGESNSGSTSSQAASGSQFLNALGTKQQANWTRHSQQTWNSGVNEVENWQLNRGESNNAASELPMWSRGQNVTGRNVVDQLNLGAEPNSGINEVMPSWSRGQHAPAQKDVEQFSLGGDSNRGRNEVLPTWSRGQGMSAQKDVEQLNHGGESKSSMDEAQPTWSRGQNMSARKDGEQLNLVGELGSGGNDIIPTWTRGQNTSVRKDVEQLNTGVESNSVMNNLPAWSRGQSVLARKEVEQLNHSGESNSDATELPMWSRGQSLSSRNVVDQLNLGADSNSGIHEVMPTWSRGQNTAARKDVEQFNLGGELTRGANDVLPTWSRGQSIPAQKDVEQLNLGVESKSGIDDSQPAWSRGQGVSAQKDAEQLNLVGESDHTGGNDIIPTWPSGQNTPARKDMEQLNLGGESNSGINSLPAWSRGQSLLSRKDVEQVNRGGEPNNVTTELPVWSRGQSVSARNVVDQPNLTSETNNGINEVLPTWSRGRNTPTRKDGEHFSLGGELSRGPNEVLPTWSRGQNPSSRKDTEQFNLGGESNKAGNEILPTWSRGQNAAVGKDVEQFSLGGESKRAPNELPTWSRGQTIPAPKDCEQVNHEGGSKNDSLPAWSRGQNAPSHKDAEQLNQAGDTNSVGTNSSGKDLLHATTEAEKRPQEEMSFLEGGAVRESNSILSPAPSPDSNVFSSAVKQKASGKVSSLSRNTLELLSKPEEPIESSSMIDEDEEEEELDQEDSGANASSISLAHLRRNQTSGPLSPQGFGLRLAPPSHLSQVGNSSRLGSSLSNLGADSSQGIATQTAKEQPQSAPSVVMDQAPTQTSINNVDKMESALAEEIGAAGALQGTTSGAAATSTSPYDSRLKSQGYLSGEGDRPSAAAGQVDGSSSQMTPSPAPNVKSGVHQSFLSGQHGGETQQAAEVSNSAPAQVVDGVINRVSEDGYPTNNSFGSSQAHSMGVLASSVSQKTQLPSSNLSVQQSGSSQTAVFSKLLSSFKDSLAEQGKQSSAQQHGGVEKGNSDRGNVGGFDSFRSQGGKQVNGLQPSQWSLDGAQMSSVKAEIFKRLSAQVQNKASQPTFGQMSILNNNNINNSNSEQTSAGSDSFPGPTPVPSHYLSGQQTLTQGPDPPGQGMASSQSHSGQPFPQGQGPSGQETTSASSHSGQIQSQSYATGQGQPTENSYPGQMFKQMSTVSGQATALDQSLPVKSHAPSGQANARSQAYPGLYAQNQALPGQASSQGQSYSGQTYNPSEDLSGLATTPGLSHSGQMFVQNHSFSGQASIPGQSLQGPDTPGQPGSSQVTSPLSNKQNRARQQRKIPQKAGGSEANQGKLQGRSTASQQPSGFHPQQTTGYSPQQSTSYPAQQSSGFPPQQSGGYQVQQSSSLPHQQPGGYQIQQSAGFPAPQSTSYVTQQSSGFPPQPLTSFQAPQSSAAFGQQSSFSTHQSSGFHPQQSAGYSGQQSTVFQSQHTLRPQSNSVQQQFGQVVPQKEVSSSIHTSQDDPSASEVQTASRLHAEDLGAKDVSVSNSKGSDAAEKASALHDSVEGSDTMQATPVHNTLEQFGSRPENQGNLLQQWQNAQSLNPSNVISDYQFQRILGARPSLAAALDAYKGDPRVYQLATAQLRASLGQAQMARQLGQYQQQLRDQSAVSASMSGAKSSFEGSQAVQNSQASQTVQAALAAHPGQTAHATQAALAAQAAHTALVVHGAQASQVSPANHAAHGVQTVQSQAQAAQAFHAAQMVAQEAQAVQVAHAAQAIQAMQAMQAAQAAQGDQTTQSAIINKNANTAARLQFLSQLAQRGQNPNGLAPWLSGTVSRSSSNAALFATRMLEGKGPDSATASATPAERLGNDELGRSRFDSLLAPPPAKKRKELPALIPWREVISQAGGYVSSISGSELEWAAATNRIPDKDPYDEVVDPADTRAVVLSRAKRRLRLTSHLMQQITPAVPDKFMQSKSSEDREGATYILSKLALAEACRLSSIARRIRDAAAARDAEEARIEKERELAMKEAEKLGQSVGGPVPLPANIADRFKLRMKHLETDLLRLEASPSAVDLVRDLQDTERIGLVNRLAVHHSNLYSHQNSDSPQRAAPQKYVTTVQMPNKLPEGLMFISL